MSAVFSRNDMLTTRNLLRWAAVGTQPSRDNASAVMELIKPLDWQSTSMVRRVLEESNRGILPSQGVCNQAQKQLQDVYDSSKEQDVDVMRAEVSRG